MYTNRMHLLEKIFLGEDTTIEFKREMPHRNSLADEIAAFANSQGGVILIGVDDYREIVGLELPDLDRVEKTVVEICEDNIEPTVPIFTEKLRIDNKNLLNRGRGVFLFTKRLTVISLAREAAKEKCGLTSWRGCYKVVRKQELSNLMNSSYQTQTKDIKRTLYRQFITEGPLKM